VSRRTWLTQPPLRREPISTQRPISWGASYSQRGGLTISGIYGSSSSAGGGIYGGGSKAAPSSHPSAGGFLGNLLGDVRDAAVGLPAGLVSSVEHPIGAAKAIGKTTWQDWSPLVHGHVGEFAHNFYAHPLAPILDVVSVFSLGAGTAAKITNLATATELAGAGGDLSNLSKLGKFGRGEAHTRVIDAVEGAGVKGVRNYSDNPAIRLRQHAAENLTGQMAEHLPKWFGKGGSIRDLSDHGVQMRQMRYQEAAAGHAAGAAGQLQIAAFMQASKDINFRPGETAHVLDTAGRTQLIDHATHLSPEHLRGASHYTLRGFHGGEVRGTEAFLAHDRRLAEAYSDRGVDPTPFTYKAKNPLVINTRAEADTIHEKVVAWAKEHHGDQRGEVGSQKYEIADWARAHGHDAIIRKYLPKYTTGDASTHETIVLHPKRLKTTTAEKAAVAVEAHGPRLHSGYSFVRAEPKGLGKIENAEDFEGALGRFGTRHTTKNAAEAMKDEHGNYLVVHDHSAKVWGHEAVNSSRFVRLLYSKPIKVWKWAILGARPAYFVNNAVGNVFMHLMSNGPSGFRGFVDAIRNTHGDTYTVHSLQQATHYLHDDPVARYYSGLYKQGFANEAAQTLTIKGKHLPARTAKVINVGARGFYPITHKVAEEFLRNLSARAELRRSQVVQSLMKGGKSFNDAVTEASASPVFRARIQAHVNNSLGEYHYLNPTEKAIRQLVPFYTWDRAIARHGVHMALEKPGRVAVATRQGEAGTHQTEQALGNIPDFLKGALPLGEGSQGRTKILTTQGLNPYASIPDVADTVGALVGIGNAKPAGVIASQINPIITGAIESATGQSLLSGARLPHRKGGIIGQTASDIVESLPQVKLAETLINGEAQPKPNKRTGQDQALPLPEGREGADRSTARGSDQGTEQAGRVRPRQPEVRGFDAVHHAAVEGDGGGCRKEVRRQPPDLPRADQPGVGIQSECPLRSRRGRHRAVHARHGQELRGQSDEPCLSTRWGSSLRRQRTESVPRRLPPGPRRVQRGGRKREAVEQPELRGWADVQLRQEHPRQGWGDQTPVQPLYGA
jgi:hypothetical protein